MRPQLKAVIFDLDGILCDTSIYHAQAWADLVRGEGYEPPADLEERVKGVSRLASLKIALGENAKNYTEDQLVELATRKNDCYLEAVKQITPADTFPGVHDLLADLKKNNIAAVLGSASRNAKVVLEGLELLDAFDGIADGYAYKHGKPEPDVFLRAAEMVGAQPEECIVVEDAAAGISAALDGGFVTVGMGRYESLCHAHLFVESLTELDAERLRALNAAHALPQWSVRGLYAAELMIGDGRLAVRGPMSGEPSRILGFCTADAADHPAEPAPIADLLGTQWHCDDEALVPREGTIESTASRVDLSTGTASCGATWTAPSGRRARWVRRWFVERGTGVLRLLDLFEPLNFSGRLEHHAVLDFADLAHKAAVVTQEEEIDPEAFLLRLRSGAEDEAAIALSLRSGGDAPRETSIRPARARASIVFDAQQDALVLIERTIATAGPRDGDEPAAVARTRLAGALAVPFADARIPAAALWRGLWRTVAAPLGADGQGASIPEEGALAPDRLGLYRMLAGSAVEDPRCGVGVLES